MNSPGFAAFYWASFALVAVAVPVSRRVLVARLSTPTRRPWTRADLLSLLACAIFALACYPNQ